MSSLTYVHQFLAWRLSDLILTDLVIDNEELHGFAVANPSTNFQWQASLYVLVFPYIHVYMENS